MYFKVELVIITFPAMKISPMTLIGGEGGEYIIRYANYID